MGPKLDQLVDFDIDTYLNSFVPISCLSYLPKSISRFLGYRDEAYKEPARLIVYVWLLFGTISSLLSIGALLRFAPGLSKYHPPVIFASLGASAILDFNAIRTPLAQPRNAFFGQVLSAIIGVAITKGFQQVSDFADLQWIAGAICCATASLAMSITGTVHPPGGATAVLAATNAEIISMGWVYVPFIMLSTTIMLTVALLVNNISRSYPVYWWTPSDLRKNKGLDLEKTLSRNSEKVLLGYGVARSASCDDTVVVEAHHMYLPEMFDLDNDEIAVLNRLQARLRWNMALNARPSTSLSDPNTG